VDETVKESHIISAYYHVEKVVEESHIRPTDYLMTKWKTEEESHLRSTEYEYLMTMWKTVEESNLRSADYYGRCGLSFLIFLIGDPGKRVTDHMSFFIFLRGPREEG
jgi:hypothetical protein